VVLASGSTFARYAAVFTTLRVDRRPEGGRRLVVNDDGHEVAFELTRDQAVHFAQLMMVDHD
jgi:hypothetical protein